MEQKTRMLIIKIKDCKVPVKGGKLTALAGRYFILSIVLVLGGYCYFLSLFLVLFSYCIVL